MSTLLKVLERIEEARERITGLSFLVGLFEGRPDFNLLLPPDEPPEEKAAGEAYCKTIEAFLTSQVDPDEIERMARPRIDKNIREIIHNYDQIITTVGEAPCAGTIHRS